MPDERATWQGQTDSSDRTGAAADRGVCKLARDRGSARSAIGAAPAVAMPLWPRVEPARQRPLPAPLGFQAQYASKVPVGMESTDTLFTAGFGYKF